MTDSTTTTQWLKAKLFEFQKLWIVIERNAKWYNYKYSSYDYIREKIWTNLNGLKILVSHKIQDYWGILYLETTISDMESDDSQTSAIPIAQNLTPQSMGSSITYYKRYNLGALLNLIIEGEDDDWAAAEKKTATQKKADSTTKPQFLDANFEKFKQWTKWKDLKQITIKKDEILAKYTVSEEMCKKLDDFLFNL